MIKNKNYPILITAIGVALIYFNTQLTVCSGWQIINPFCWGISFFTHQFLMWGGIALLIYGIYKIIRGGK